MSNDVAPAPSPDADDRPDAAPAAPIASTASAPAEPSAFSWLEETFDDDRPEGSLDATLAAGAPARTPDLLRSSRRRSRRRRGRVLGVLIPLLILVLLAGGYVSATLLWPLDAVRPELSTVAIEPASAPLTTSAWPAAGSAAVGVGGLGVGGDDAILASTPDADQIASITKVITALLVLEKMPLAVGEQGPDFAFTAEDQAEYLRFIMNNESALDVPVDGVLTQYQLLEGMLLGSASNYAERLVNNLWESDALFAHDAFAWLTAHDVPGISIIEPTGISMANLASPAALIPLAERALENPVIAEIVAKQSVVLPGAGEVENTNPLMSDPGVLGIKTGSLDGYNLLSAKDVKVGDTTVRLYAAVLGQPDSETRATASRALYAQLEQELQIQPSVTAETVTARVETPWGTTSDIVTTADAEVVLWNGGSGDVSTTFSLDEHRDADDVVGSLTVTGPLDAETVDLRLTDDLGEPTTTWRLTHPLELFGWKD